MRYLVTFEGRKAKLPDGKLFLGVNGDNLIDEVAFAAPEYEGATAYLKMRAPGSRYAEFNEGKIALDYDGENEAWVLSVNRSILALGYKIDMQVQLEAPVDGDDVLVWQSEIFPAYVADAIDADGAIPAHQAPYLQQLDIRVQQAAERAENASRSQPYVGANGNWYVWNAYSMSFVDSGVKAQGPQGPQGPATIEVDPVTEVGAANVENVGTSQNVVLKFTLPGASGAGVSLADAGGYFPEKNAEAALQMVASQLAETADNAALWRTATGNPATIYPVPKSSLYPRIELVATQEGEGDPSPENIRPIVPSLLTGQKVKAKRTGKNLNPYPVERASWTSTGASNYPAGVNYAGVRFKIPVLPNTEYIASQLGLTSASSPSFYYTEFDSSNNFISRNLAASGIFTTSADCRYIGIHYHVSGDSITIENNAAIQLELGSVATPYEPYSGADYDLLTADRDFYGLPDAPVIVDAEAGVIRNQTGYIASYDGETVPAGWVSSTGALTTGAQVVYPLAAPEIIPITPPVIAALERLKRTEARQNVLTATANDAPVSKLDVTYQKSPIRESDELAAAIAALA